MKCSSAPARSPESFESASAIFYTSALVTVPAHSARIQSQAQARRLRCDQIFVFQHRCGGSGRDNAPPGQPAMRLVYFGGVWMQKPTDASL